MQVARQRKVSEHAWFKTPSPEAMVTSRDRRMTMQAIRLGRVEMLVPSFSAGHV